MSDSEARRQTDILKFEVRIGGSLGGVPHEMELVRLLASSRVGLADERWLVKLEMLDARIQQLWVAQAATHVTHAQVVSYYKHH